MNRLYFGDNLSVLRKEIDSESVDLIYLDPPFNSNASYNVLFKEKTGKESAAQIMAFDDTWHWNRQESASAYEQVVKGPNRRLSDLIQALRKFLGENDMMAYLVMMAIRLAELHRVLKPTGSLYLHCDPTASHYLKLALDAVFTPMFFRNEIVWQRTSAHNDPKRYGRVHDVLLFYTKTDRYIWNQQYTPLSDENFASHDFEIDTEGRKYRKRDLTAPAHGRNSGQYEWNGRRPPSGRMWSYTKENMARLEAEGRIVYTKTGMPRLKIYIEDLRGIPYQDVWARPELWLNSAAGERLHYPTQKPETLLERIIKSSSNEGDVVLDPFCGCGTTVAVAERLRRDWVGIDITHLAIDLIVRRLRRIEKACPYVIKGYPEDVAGAESLAERDKYQFQWWAAIKAGGDWSGEMKKGADRGIDGLITFFDDLSGQAKRAIIQVKGGQHPSVNDVRVLKAVIEREKAPIGVLILLKAATREMMREAAIAGFYEPTAFRGRKFARIQILTVQDLFDAKRIEHPDMPLSMVKPAERKTKDEQRSLF